MKSMLSMTPTKRVAAGAVLALAAAPAVHASCADYADAVCAWACDPSGVSGWGCSGPDADGSMTFVCHCC
jgi:hypothetical protein